MRMHLNTTPIKNKPQAQIKLNSPEILNLEDLLISTAFNTARVSTSPKNAKNTSMLSPLSAPATGIVPMLCPFLRHNEIFLSSPALAITISATKSHTKMYQTKAPCLITQK